MYSQKFRKVQRKIPGLEFLCDKVTGLLSATLLKKKPCQRCFSVKFVKFVGTRFLIEHFEQLILSVENRKGRTS